MKLKNIKIFLIICCFLMLCGMAPVKEQVIVESVSPLPHSETVKVQERVEIIFNSRLIEQDVNEYTFRLSDGTQDIRGQLYYIPALRKVIFRPEDNMKTGTVYTMKIFKGVRNVYGNYLEEDYSWNFSTGRKLDTVAPFVSNVYPDDHAENIPLNDSIHVTFSEYVKDSVASKLSVSCAGERIKGKFQLNKPQNVLIFKPEKDFEPGKTYDVSLKKFYDREGNESAINYKWSFVTRFYPEVVSVIPKDRERKVIPTTRIIATFNKRIAADEFNEDTVMLLDENGKKIPVSFVYNELKKEFFITPGELAYGTEYILKFSGIEDEWANIMPDRTFSFHTLDVIPPEVVRFVPPDKDTAVKLDARIIVEFSEDINVKSLNDRTFVVSTKEGRVPGKIEYRALARSANFVPEGGWQKGVEYRVAVTTDIEDHDGNRLKVPVYFGFKTMPYSEEELVRKVAGYTMDDEVKAMYEIQKLVGIPFYEKYVNEEIAIENSIGDEIAPELIDVYPEADMRNVPVDTAISAIFSERIDRRSLNEATFRLFSKFGNVPGRVSYDIENYSAVFSPAEPLQPLTRYTIRFTSGITDIVGNELIPREWEFYTGKTADSETIAAIPKVKEIEYEDPLYDVSDSEIFQTMPSPESLEIAQAKEELFYETQVDFSRAEWALETVRYLQWKYAPSMSVDLGTKIMKPKRYEQALVIKEILKNLKKRRFDFLYRRKWGIVELIKIEQIVIEFELELKNMGVDYSFFEDSLKKVGIPVLKIREDMNRGIIKISAVK